MKNQKNILISKSKLNLLLKNLNKISSIRLSLLGFKTINTQLDN